MIKGSEEYKKRQRDYMRVYLSEKKKDELNAKRRAQRKGASGDKIRAQQRAKHYRNRETILKRNKERYEADRGHARMQSRKSKYGISKEQYEEMLKAQNECCAICGIEQSKLKRPLGVDHCHKTKVVRRLLCSPCNTAIGLFKEDAIRMRVAINYLSDGPSWNNYMTEAVHGGVQ